ncbi:VOC family protein [Streptomyces sp. NRRL F-2580]|uniref:VOC family protein n=1 Tax=Streptomyces sp. NRRL F-2580 TaxID=1463841 RepID=UPI0004C524C6|nr:VOC family protein [Streptomyces sp. NRRL F-2580]
MDNPRSAAPQHRSTETVSGAGAPEAAASDIGQTGEEQWHVLADPEGNEFCLLKPRLNPL